MVIGTLVGLMSGFFEGWPAAVLFRLTEWFLVLPFLPLAIVLASVLGRSLLNIAIVIGVTSWPGTALLIRSQTLSIKERPYLERARVLGAGRWQLMRKHVLPNVMPMVFANTTLTVAIAILSETTLSFLGLGDPTRVSWGSMLESAFAVGAITTGAWWFIVPPGVCVVLVVLSFTLVGQALEEILNPQLRRSLMAELLEIHDLTPVLPDVGGAAARRTRGRPCGARRRGGRGRRRVGVRQVLAGQHGAAAAAQGRDGHRHRPGLRRRRAHRQLGRPSRPALGRRVHRVPGRTALAQPRATRGRPDRRTDPAARAGRARREGPGAGARPAGEGRPAPDPGSAPTRTSSPEGSGSG